MKPGCTKCFKVAERNGDKYICPSCGDVVAQIAQIPAALRDEEQNDERRQERMIRLTGTNGTAIYINPDKIISFNEDDGETYIDYGYDRYIVTEPATEVARKVLEYNLVMKRYPVALSLEKPSLWETEEKKLKQLAGLEE